RPIWPYSSSVRACTATARDVVPGSAVLSTIRTRTPSRVSHRANTRPVGPAPMMRTSVSRIDDASIIKGLADFGPVGERYVTSYLLETTGHSIERIAGLAGSC